MKQTAHLFRGEYIDLCAQIEQWAVEVLSSEAARNSGRIKGKGPYLFGQKLKLVAELAGSENSIFSKPSRVGELLAQINDYAQLRAELAHATVRVVGQNSEAVFAFDVRADRPFPHGSTRFWLTPADAARIISELKQIVKQIRDQNVRPSA
jgi:hypothetical protein